ncbi:MAG: response regulator [Gammaproteobacteria bacterium]|nr:MAG: response regulator [Gammaproteobacteria bacterium]
MKNILIVDDEPHVVRVMTLALEKNGYKVVSAFNGEQALDKLKEKLPDFLITDIDMPRMNGRDLCKKIDEEMPDRKFPILVLTSKTEIEHREWTRDIQHTMFLEKPVSIRKLIKLLDDYRNKFGLVA